MVRIDIVVSLVRLAKVAIRTIKKTPLGPAVAAEDRLLHNGVTCPERTLARLSNKDGSGPAMVIPAPL